MPVPKSIKSYEKHIIALFQTLEYAPETYTISIPFESPARAQNFRLRFYGYLRALTTFQEKTLKENKGRNPKVEIETKEALKRIDYVRETFGIYLSGTELKIRDKNSELSYISDLLVPDIIAHQTRASAEALRIQALIAQGSVQRDEKLFRTKDDSQSDVPHPMSEPQDTLPMSEDLFAPLEPTEITQSPLPSSDPPSEPTFRPSFRPQDINE
jgi:hypothetical protein